MIEMYIMRGWRPLCPAGDYRWRSELNQNCADCQGKGSASQRVPQEREEKAATEGARAAAAV